MGYRDRYKEQYGLNTSSLAPSSRPKPTAQDERDEDGADFWRFIGDIAPTVGTVAGTAIGAGVGSMAGGVGAIPGAGLGAALGGAAGQLGQGLAYGGADAMTSDREDKEAAFDEDENDKAQRRAMIISTLGSLRR